MKQQLFQKTTVRLTAVYLAVLMLLAVVFSIALFRVSVSELDRNYVHAVDFANNFVGFRLDPQLADNYLSDRTLERDEGHQHLIKQLVVLGAVILVSGGFFSYALARRTLEPIEEAHMSLERFTADASHELRTPLTTMRTEIEVALLNPELNVKESRKLLESNLEEVDRLSILSERLLTLARLDEYELPHENVAVSELVSKSIEATHARAAAKDVTLKKKLSGAASLATVQGDEASLSEALIILLDNAVKYSEKGATVIVEASTRYKSVLIAVKDKGIGIETADIPKIFERFYRADQSRTRANEHGYGLGLALAHKIIDLHTGKIEVTSTPGKGSTFTVLLPLA